jgi:hypothetical protein
MQHKTINLKPEEKHKRLEKSCSHCDFVGSSSELLDHLKNLHSKANEVTCTLCKFQTTNEKDLNNHLRQYHKVSTTAYLEPDQTKAEDERKRFESPCPQCDFVASSAEFLTDHVGSVHPKKSTLARCRQCDHVAINNSELSVHSKEHNKKKKDDDNRAGTLLFYSKAPDRLEEHDDKSAERTMVNAVACKQCDFKTTNWANLRSHLKGTHKVVFMEHRVPDYEKETTIYID